MILGIHRLCILFESYSTFPNSNVGTMSSPSLQSKIGTLKHKYLLDFKSFSSFLEAWKNKDIYTYRISQKIVSPLYILFLTLIGNGTY